MKIKIVAGVFGHRNGARVEAVRAGDPPIEVEESIAERLIKAGVAELVKEEPEPAPVETSQIEADDETESVDEFPEYNVRMTRAQLVEIAEQVGIDADEIKNAETKGDLIALLDEARDEFEADAEAPSFDPAGDML